MDIQTIERRRRTMQIPREQLCRIAGLSNEAYRQNVSGQKQARPATIAKLNRALDRFHVGYAQEAGELAPHATYKACVILAALYLEADPKNAINSVPSRRATADPVWMEAARARRLGIWIANQFFGFSQADLGRAAGVPRQTIHETIKDIELEIETDPGLARLCRQIERVFEP